MPSSEANVLSLSQSHSVNAFRNAYLSASALETALIFFPHEPKPQAQSPKILRKIKILRGGQAGVWLSDLELIALADETTRKPLRASAPRWLAHQQGLWHQAVHVYFIDRKGRIVLQRRSWTLTISPGKLQASVSGHVDASDLEGIHSLADPGWVYFAAMRESQEEMGIALDLGRLEIISEMNQIRRDQPNNKEFATILRYRLTNEELKQVQARYNLSEVEELALLPMKSFARLVRTHPHEFSGSIQHLLQYYPEIFARLLSATPGIPHCLLQQC